MFKIIACFTVSFGLGYASCKYMNVSKTPYSRKQIAYEKEMAEFVLETTFKVFKEYETNLSEKRRKEHDEAIEKYQTKIK